jgi:hypothetical protein
MASSGSIVRPCPCRPSQRYLSFLRLRVVLIVRAIDEGEHLEMLFANFVLAFARHILVSHDTTPKNPGLCGARFDT